MAIIFSETFLSTSVSPGSEVLGPDSLGEKVDRCDHSPAELS